MTDTSSHFVQFEEHDEQQRRAQDPRQHVYDIHVHDQAVVKLDQSFGRENVPNVLGPPPVFRMPHRKKEFVLSFSFFGLSTGYSASVEGRCARQMTKNLSKFAKIGSPALPVSVTSGPSSATESQWESNTSSTNRSGVKEFLIIGFMHESDPNPKEECTYIYKRGRLFLYMWASIIKLRGIRHFLSLKGVTGFTLYKCNWKTGSHTRVTELSALDRATLKQFYLCYNSWRPVPSHVCEAWNNWVHHSINKGYIAPDGGEPGEALSLEVLLGWSPLRISLLVMTPVLLSLVIGLWYQRGQTDDATIVQTAWTIASYIVTASALVAALIGFISNSVS